MRTLTEDGSRDHWKPSEMDMDHGSISELNSTNFSSMWKTVMVCGVPWYYLELRTYLIVISLGDVGTHFPLFL